MSEEYGIIGGKVSEEMPLSDAEKNSIIIRYTTRKILTDIRDYLVSWRDNPAIDYSAEKWIDETALSDLTEYAEKLGVEL